MDYAGQQPLAMTSTLLIVHGYDIPTSSREIIGAKTSITLARFHPTVTVRVFQRAPFHPTRTGHQTGVRT